MPDEAAAPTTPVVLSLRYAVNTLVVNAQKRLGLVGLLDILQDAAWIHGGRLGLGFDAMMAKGLVWVLARQRVAMRVWPDWGDTIEARTSVRPADGLVVLRDTEIWRGGTRVGESAASWLVLDARTRRPARTAVIGPAVPTRDDGGLGFEPARIPAAEGLEPLAWFEARASDLDANGHVNNTRYARWILDAVPASAHAALVVREYEASFLAETGLGDRVEIEWDGAAAAAGDALRFQGRRARDGKVVFAARLRVEPAPGATGA